VCVAQRPTADSPTLAAGSRASRNQIRFLFAALFQVIFDSLFSGFFPGQKCLLCVESAI
jgi:hypothetical protein